MSHRLHILRYSLLLASTILTAIAGWGHPAIPEAFVNAPRPVIPTIDSLTRVEMLLYHQAGSPTPSKNLLGGSAKVITLSPETITFSTSGASEMTVAQIPFKGDSALIVLNTVATPALDTQITMYSASWQPLPAKSQLPSLNDLSLWLTPEGKKHIALVENAVPFITARCTYDPSTLTLTAVSTIRRLIGKDNYAPIDSYLKTSILYKWTGSKWSIVKE